MRSVDARDSIVQMRLCELGFPKRCAVVSCRVACATAASVQVCKDKTEFHILDKCLRTFSFDCESDSSHHLVTMVSIQFL